VCDITRLAREHFYTTEIRTATTSKFKLNSADPADRPTLEIPLSWPRTRRKAETKNRKQGKLSTDPEGAVCSWRVGFRREIFWSWKGRLKRLMDDKSSDDDTGKVRWSRRRQRWPTSWSQSWCVYGSSCTQWRRIKVVAWVLSALLLYY